MSKTVHVILRVDYIDDYGKKKMNIGYCEDESKADQVVERLTRWEGRKYQAGTGWWYPYFEIKEIKNLFSEDETGN